ncbi:hypothetical protein BDP27DRAFT_1332890 [Rhodocollybia butyracea]|uniref:DUF6593 domain-containing protein n=1 Tax=Rhodocollybia butyracea TaxID=206335 RepID=A0A9P5U3T7_9AGAR|nr:hypothetical protein BDP27DRAFT_1332890 [Rhodocollybia butyracea]
MTNFFFTKDSPKSTDIVEEGHDADSSSSYRVETPSVILHRAITTIYKGLNKEKVGSIEIHHYGHDVVNVRGTNISLTTSFAGTSGEFTASDGQAYKWAWKQPAIELLAHDGSETLVARYDRAHILVYPQALHIVDEVLVTLLYMLQTTKRDDTHGQTDIVASGGLAQPG